MKTLCGDEIDVEPQGLFFVSVRYVGTTLHSRDKISGFPTLEFIEDMI
jgi:hypothetical protein